MKRIPHITPKKLWIAGCILLVAVLAVILCIQWIIPRTNSTDPDATQETKNELRLPDLLGTAKTIKGNLVSALEDIKQNNWESARAKLKTARSDIASVRAWIKNIPFLVDLVPQAENIYTLLNAADMAIGDIALPAVDFLETYPLSGISVGDGFDTKLICRYVDFAESVMPKLEEFLDAANTADLSVFDSEGKLTGALDAANNLLAIYHENPEMLGAIKVMLGAQEDRLYLLAVQNPSEIRASGGFPGSMGLLRIENGILTLGDFESVVKFLAAQKPKNIQITREETELFNYLSTMRIPRDADLCPDFPRVAHIWASSYEEWHKEPVSGIISVTPHMVQRFLAATNDEIELFDGLVLNKDNATKVLIHDIYFKYFNRQHPDPNGAVISDQLFADAAKKTMKKLTGNISVSRLLAYLPVMKDSIKDRTLMLWMKDEQEQTFITDMGWSGELNKDPQKPQAGVYVNVVSASKMGWFLLMDTEIGERTKNPDGSYTYPITVTFSNNVTKEEINAATNYISGGLDGSMRTVAYFFAPAGGSVENFTADNGQTIQYKTYNGMSLGFTDQFLLRPNASITITYTVTTAPGVDTPLTFSKTPTAQGS